MSLKYLAVLHIFTIQLNIFFMELPNIHFKEAPIDFKEINPEDFPNFEVEAKIIITPDENGYINEKLQNSINLDKKNTVVINASVGQGKTYSIIEIVKKYYEKEGFIIFIASPYISLVQQYFDKVHEAGVPENEIYRYEYIGVNQEIDAWDSKVQILTVNALLGNPGEDAFLNSQAKRDYINYLVRKCEETQTKVIFIYDEIHDSIHNFKEEYIFNLWKWRNVIHKNFILSATYNEASKVVIEYLTELTNNNLKIIESERIRFESKQSELFLHYNPAYHYNYNNDGIVSLVKNLVENGKSIDILSYSKKLAEDICKINNEGIGYILFEAFGELQNCTSGLVDNQRPNREVPINRFNPKKCNVGTNFKTGVSIEKENHAFIIIMPPAGRKSSFKNNFGIFTDGINSVIQALARQRKKGEIHIILPPPEDFDFDTLPFKGSSYRKIFSSFYNSVKKKRDNKVKYHSFNEQEKLLKDFYINYLRRNIEEEICLIEELDRKDKARLEFPEYKHFLLEKGEKYLANTFDFFGGDLSTYITYCAITNQFVNCNLTGVFTKPSLFFIEGEVQKRLESYWSEYMGEDIYNSLYINVTDLFKYYEFQNVMFDNYKVYLKDKESHEFKEVLKWENKMFQQQLLIFIQRKFSSKDKSLYLYRGHDLEYTRGDYFRSCISHLNRLSPKEKETLSPKADAFEILEYFRKKILEISKTTSRKDIEIKYVPNSPPANFISENDIEKFNFMWKTLIEENFIKYEVFEYKRSFIRTKDTHKRIKSFYSYLIQDFFKSTSILIYEDDKQTRVKEITEIEIPCYKFVFDFVSPASHNFPDSYWESEAKQKETEEILKTFSP